MEDVAREAMLGQVRKGLETTVKTEAKRDILSSLLWEVAPFGGLDNNQKVGKRRTKASENTWCGLLAIWKNPAISCYHTPA